MTSPLSRARGESLRVWFGVVVSLVVQLCVGCGDAPSSPRACAADRDCASGVCLSRADQDAVDLDPLPLTCGVVADGGEDSPCCQAAADCARGVCLVSGACAVPCVDASDCAATERCAPVYAKAGEAALQTLHACVSRVELPSDVRVTEVLLENVLSSEPAGAAIDLPAVEGTGIFVLEHRSETLWPRTVECRTPLCVRRLETRDPTPTLLFDADMLVPGNAAPLNTVNTSIDSVVSTILLPNGSPAALSEQGYRATIRSESAGDLALTQIERSQQGTRLDLHVHYVGAGGLRPEGDRGPPFIADALEQTDAILGQAGIRIGNVCQTELVGALSQQLSVIDPPRFGLLVELPELFALSAGARGSAIHVFLVDQADVALGISGGLPGPPGLHGTGSSGVVMSVTLFDRPAQLGQALAHELGHFLGLFHPREADNVTLDPLGDTPNEATNLMFRTFAGGESLTSAQRQVIRASPLLD